jgi:hypothetical protein
MHRLRAGDATRRDATPQRNESNRAREEFRERTIGCVMMRCTLVAMTPDSDYYRRR